MIQKLIKQPLLFIFFLLSSAVVFAQAKPPKKSYGNNNIGRWQLVGEKQVDRIKEWDDFYPKGNGIFSAFKLKILNSRVKFEKMVIVYDNGRKQEVSLRSEIPQNGESRVVDVEGDRRKIRKISFKYSTAGIFKDKAKVQVWGKI